MWKSDRIRISPRNPRDCIARYTSLLNSMLLLSRTPALRAVMRRPAPPFKRPTVRRPRKGSNWISWSKKGRRESNHSCEAQDDEPHALYQHEDTNPRQDRDNYRDEEQGGNHGNSPREHHCQNHGEKPDNANPRVERLQESGLAGDLFRRHGTSPGTREPEHCGSKEPTARHQECPTSRRRWIHCCATRETNSKMPTANIAERK